MILFTRIFPYAELVDVHFNSGWHIKISRKRQIFICDITIQAQSTAYANLNSKST